VPHARQAATLLTHADDIELTWLHVLTAAIGTCPPFAALRTSGSYWGSPAVRSPSLGRSAVGNADAATAAANDSVEVREYRSAMFCDENEKKGPSLQEEDPLQFF
jgi:hypothetical protein